MYIILAVCFIYSGQSIIMCYHLIHFISYSFHCKQFDFEKNILCLNKIFSIKITFFYDGHPITTDLRENGLIMGYYF